MTWRKFFRKASESGDAGTGPDASPAATPRPTMAPHLAQAIERRSANGERTTADDPARRKLGNLLRQRHAILLDIEQGELAASPDNPWTNRIALLGEAMKTVADDLAIASEVVPGPFHPVPTTPIAIDTVDHGDLATVAFAVGDERFTYSDDPDWAERGHQIARTELVRRHGNIDNLIPVDTPRELRDVLRGHLDNSLFVLASDLRDRSLDDDPFPAAPTLADLAIPCPVCGGWTDWRGACQDCARRNDHVRALKREESRLLDERTREAEERHRLVEGTSLARTRLRNVEVDLAGLGEPLE